MTIPEPQDSAKIKSQNGAKVPHGPPCSKQIDDDIAIITDNIGAERATLLLPLRGPKQGGTAVGTAASSLEREHGISWG